MEEYPLRLFDLSGKPLELNLPGSATIVDVVSEVEPVKLSYERSGRQGVCNLDGASLIEPLYKKILSYNEGLYVVLSAERASVVFLDDGGKPLGELSLPSYWLAPEGFRDGLLRGVSPSAGPIFLKPDASFLSTPKLIDASSFSCGFAAVTLAGDMFKTDCAAFIDKEGHILADKKFAYAQSFANNRAIVGVRLKGSDKLRMGVVNLAGQYVIEPIWDKLRVNDDNTYLARTNFESGTTESGAEKIGTTSGDLILNASGEVVCRFDHCLTSRPGAEIPQLASDQTLEAELKLAENKAPLVAVDRAGHIFSDKSWPVEAVVAPVADTSSAANLAGLRGVHGWVTEPNSDFYTALPGKRWLARKLR